MSQQITRCIIDLDGTLLDCKYRYFEVYRKILEKKGGKPLPFKKYWALKKKAVPFSNLIKAKKLEINALDFQNEWLMLIEKPKFLKLDRIFDGVAKKLAAWRKQKISLILVTMRRNRKNLIRQLKEKKLLQFFDKVIMSSPQEHTPSKAKDLMKRVKNIRHESCLWIGDTEADISAAKVLNCKVWALTSGVRTRNFLKHLSPDFLSSHFKQVDPFKIK